MEILQLVEQFLIETKKKTNSNSFESNFNYTQNYNSINFDLAKSGKIGKYDYYTFGALTRTIQALILMVRIFSLIIIGVITRVQAHLGMKDLIIFMILITILK